MDIPTIVTIISVGHSPTIHLGLSSNTGANYFAPVLTLSSNTRAIDT